MSDSATPCTVAHQAFLSFSISWSLLRLMSIESMMPPSPLALNLCQHQSLFPVSRLFTSGEQSIGDFSFSLLQMLHFLRIEILCQPNVKQVYHCHFFNSICSLCVSLSHFYNSYNIYNFFIVFNIILLFLMLCSVISDL